MYIITFENYNIIIILLKLTKGIFNFTDKKP